MQSSFLGDLAGAGFVPDEIDLVLCTHLHFDHVGLNTHLVNGKWVPTFPNARYLFGRKEHEHWTMLKETHGYHDLNHLYDAVQPVVDAGLVDLIEPDHAICPELSLRPTPGHTPGHVSILIESRGERAIVTGDLLHNPIQLERPEDLTRDIRLPYGGSDAAGAEYRALSAAVRYGGLGSTLGRLHNA